MTINIPPHFYLIKKKLPDRHSFFFCTLALLIALVIAWTVAYQYSQEVPATATSQKISSQNVSSLIGDEIPREYFANGMMKSRENKLLEQTTIILDEPTYIQYLVWDFTTQDPETEIRYRMIINGHWELSFYDERRDIYPGRLTGKGMHIPIRSEVETIVIEVFDLANNPSTPKDFSLGGFAIDNNTYFNWALFAKTALLIFLPLLALLHFIKKISLSFSALVLIFIAGFGGFLTFAQPPQYSYDEYMHLLRSYAVADGNLFFTNWEVRDYPQYISTLNHGQGGDFLSYADALKANADYQQMAVNDMTEQSLFSSAASYLFIPYLFSGLGVLIAKLCNASILTALHLARLGNLIFYLLCIGISLKISAQSNKYFIAALSLLSIMVILAMNLSPDVVIIGTLLLAVAVILRLKENHLRLTTKQYLGLLVLVSLPGLSKCPYAFCVLLVLLLSEKNLPATISWKKNIALAWLLSLLIFGIAYLYGNAKGLALWPVEGMDATAQLSGILHDPLQYVKLLWQYLAGTLTQDTLAMGYTFSYIGTLVPLYGLLPLALTAYLFATSGNDEDLLTPPNKLVLFIIAALSYGLSATALYLTFTPVGKWGVEGYQARYFIPMLIMLLLMLKTNSLKSKVPPRILEFAIILTSYASLYQVVQRVFSNFYC